MGVRFGEFTLDRDRREVCRGDEIVYLTPKAFDLLSLLVARSPAVVPRQELFDALWPDVMVSSASLKNLVSELRCALDDHQRMGRFLRTVHGRGYAFIGEGVVEGEGYERGEANPAVALHRSGKTLPLWSGDNTVGRGRDCSVVIDDSDVSRHHAIVRLGPEGVTIRDLDSKNGTFVNGRRIVVAELEDADRIGLGSVDLTVRISSGEDTTRTGGAR